MKFFSIIRLLPIIYLFISTTPFYAEITRDLDLNAIFTTINYTQSNQGGYALRSLLAQPITDLTILEGRKEIISHLAQNATLSGKLTTLLKAFANNENDFERMLQPVSDIENAAFQEFYFSNSYLREWNYSPLHLELGQIAYLGNLCSSMVQHALAFAIFTWGLDEEHVCPSHPAKDHTDKHKNHSHKHKHKEDGHTHNDKCNHNHAHDDASISSIKKLFKSKEFKYGFQLWHGIAQLQELYSIQAIVRNNMKCIKELQTHLMGIARGIRIINHIHATLKNYPEITIHLAHYNDLENISTSTNVSEKLTLLLKLLNSHTFKGQPSVFSRIGVILAAYKVIQEIGHELQPALMAIGEIDAYLSCAYLFNSTQLSTARYSFAHYTTTSSTPVIHAHNFWHPLMCSNAIQLNSIDLGLNDAPRNILLTGPNSCGKSPTLKAVTLCAYLAQTVTLVPAQEYHQTLCKEIYSSIVVSDNIQKNKSLFVAELTDAEDLLNRVENLGTGEYMFIVLDELFTSTHHEKGQSVAYQLLEYLYASPQVITIVATHFDNLSALADIPAHNCTNYTLNNFKLVPGIGLHDNSFDIVKKQTKSRLLI